ncbi:MAG: hypothetical protein ACHQIM_22020 [Sphingobacteriales bacterium]
MRSFSLVKFIFLFGIIIFNFGVSYGKERTNKWPSVVPFKKSFHLDDNSSKAGVKVFINGNDGKPLYYIECHAGGYGDTNKFSFSGDFSCQLESLYSHDPYSTLFTEDFHSSSDTDNRGFFFVERLIGKCGDYPEFGRERSFRLRRMQVTLAISNMRLGNNPEFSQKNPKKFLLKSFDFEVTVLPDETAKSKITSPVPYQEPKLIVSKSPNETIYDCSEVRKK